MPILIKVHLSKSKCLCRYGHIPLKKRVKIAQNWYDGICKRATPLKWKTK